MSKNQQKLDRIWRKQIATPECTADGFDNDIEMLPSCIHSLSSTKQPSGLTIIQSSSSALPPSSVTTPSLLSTIPCLTTTMSSPSTIASLSTAILSQSVTTSSLTPTVSSSTSAITSSKSPAVIPSLSTGTSSLSSSISYTISTAPCSSITSPPLSSTTIPSLSLIHLEMMHEKPKKAKAKSIRCANGCKTEVSQDDPAQNEAIQCCHQNEQFDSIEHDDNCSRWLCNNCRIKLVINVDSLWFCCDDEDMHDEEDENQEN